MFQRRPLAICLLLAFLTLLAYARVITCGFVPWDDPQYVTDNPWIQRGLTWQSVQWAFTTDYASMWMPLVWLSYLLDVTVAGVSPVHMHLVNLGLHVANVVLLFLVLRRLTGADVPSAIAAGCFALHPLQVESVAWITERKDVLSTLFWILSMGAYAAYARRPSWGRYTLVALSLALGLMAKAMLVTLPCVLLLLDYWPLERLTSAEGRIDWRRAAWLVVEKLPLFGLAAVAALLTYLAESHGGAVGSSDHYPFDLRLANAAVSYLAYLGKVVWPCDLAAYYPHPAESLRFTGITTTFVVQIIAAVITLLLVTYGAWRLRHTHRYLLVGWLWFLGTLVPVIGVIQVGTHGMADRYMYVPSIGVWIIVAWTGAELVKRVPASRLWLANAATAALVACLALTWQQVGYWRDGVALFSHNIEVTTNNGRAHGLLGNALLLEGRYSEALPHFEEGLRWGHHEMKCNHGMALALSALNRRDEAAVYFRDVLKLDPNNASVHNNFGRMLADQGQLAAAAEEFTTALQINPALAKAHNNLGEVLYRQKKYPEAEQHFQAALAINPRYDGARQRLELMRAEVGGSR